MPIYDAYGWGIFQDTSRKIVTSKRFQPSRRRKVRGAGSGHRTCGRRAKSSAPLTVPGRGDDTGNQGSLNCVLNRFKLARNVWSSQMPGVSRPGPNSSARTKCHRQGGKNMTRMVFRRCALRRACAPGSGIGLGKSADDQGRKALLGSMALSHI